MPPEKLHWAHLTTRWSPPGCAPGARPASSSAPTTSSSTTTRAAATSPSTSTPTAARGLHPRREGLHALHTGLPALSAPGSPRSTPSCSAASARSKRWTGISQSIVLARATDPDMHAAGQDGGFVSALLDLGPRARHHRRRARLGPRGRRHHLEGDPGRRAHPGRGAGDRRLPLHLLGQPHGLRARRSRAAPSGSRSSAWAARPRPRRSCRPARRARWRGASCLSIGLLCSKTFDDAIFPELFEARYGLRPRGHREDEHQGRLPGLDARRLLPRGPAQGGPRVDAGGLQGLSGLRGRARRHLDRRDRRVQRLDAHHHPHRARPRALRRHGGRTVP